MYAPYATVTESAPDLLGARRDAHQSSMAIVAEGAAAGLLRAGDPMELALVLWSSMHGLAVLLTEGQLGRHDTGSGGQGGDTRKRAVAQRAVNAPGAAVGRKTAA